MDDPSQDAEVNFGTHQRASATAPRGLAGAGIEIGAYPTGAGTGRTQLIDMDDILAVEAGAPGNGTAMLMHEIVENYTGHAGAPHGGMGPFRPAHAAGVAAESEVASELVQPGARVADATAPTGTPHVTQFAIDYESYYVVLTEDATRAHDVTITNSRRAAKALVSVNTLDDYVTGSDTFLAGPVGVWSEEPHVHAAIADLRANPLATVLVEGFTDDVGAEAQNQALAQRRAEHVRLALMRVGIARGRIHVVGRAGTFIAPNDSDAGRARNRRVVITVTRPAP
jgi:hypothetical protein